MISQVLQMQHLRTSPHLRTVPMILQQRHLPQLRAVNSDLRSVRVMSKDQGSTPFVDHGSSMIRGTSSDLRLCSGTMIDGTSWNLMWNLDRLEGGTSAEPLLTWAWNLWNLCGTLINGTSTAALSSRSFRAGSGGTLIAWNLEPREATCRHCWKATGRLWTQPEPWT